MEDRILRMIQILSGTVGIASTIIIIIQNYQKLRAESRVASDAESPQEGPAALQTSEQLLPPRDLADLAFALLLAAIISIIATDTILISGRIGPIKSSTIVIAICIILLISALVFTSWVLKTEDIVLIFLSFATLFALVFSINGPFTTQVAASSEVKNLAPLVPYFLLVAIVVGL